MPPTEATSFADAAALMIIQMLERATMQPDYANQLITLHL
jgi:hypothetical protein